MQLKWWTDNKDGTITIHFNYAGWDMDTAPVPYDISYADMWVEIENKVRSTGYGWPDVFGTADPAASWTPLPSQGELPPPEPIGTITYEQLVQMFITGNIATDEMDRAGAAKSAGEYQINITDIYGNLYTVILNPIIVEHYVREKDPFGNYTGELVIWERLDDTTRDWMYPDWRTNPPELIPIEELIEYPCPQCGAIFYSQPELDAHIQQEHPPPVEYPCPQCGAIFYSQADLDTHIQQFHPEIPEEIPTWLIVGSILALSLITVMIVRR